MHGCGCFPKQSGPWRLSMTRKLAQEFELKAYKRKIETIVAENTFMAELQNRIVPFIVQYDVFWTRYFYQCALNFGAHLGSVQAGMAKPSWAPSLLVAHAVQSSQARP